MSSLHSCVCVWDPPAWRTAPSLKHFLWVHSEWRTHTPHMKQTDERSRCPRPSGSHGICGMLLYFPPNSPVFGFFCWVSANVCMCCWLFSTTRSQSQVIECMNQADLSHWSADWDRKTWKTTSCFSSMYVTLFRREFIRKYST